MKTPVTIVYDGECPFCSNYVHIVRLQECYAVTMLNAREHPDVAREYHDRGYDLSEGMIVEFAGAVHFGADALVALSLATSPNGLLNKLLSKVFGAPILARALYPSMKLGRRLTLFALRRSPEIPTS